MAYAYWKSDKTDDTAVFDLFFRNNPFHGEFTIFAGLEECLKFLDSFHYSQSGECLDIYIFLFILVNQFDWTPFRYRIPEANTARGH